MASIQAKADSVRAAVSSTSTCTASIATILSELLLPKTTATDTKAPLNSENISKGPEPKTKGTAAPAAKTRGRKTVDQENTREHVKSLSAKERSILATEVINATLRALSEAIKAPSRVRKQASSKDLSKASARHALRRSSSVPQAPLGPRSLNRVTSSPSLSTRMRSSSSASITSSGNRSTAECARIAFACLRALQASKVSGVDLPHLQLENGMSVLVGKLIALGLDDLAIREIRILKKRLDSGGQPVPKKNASVTKAAQITAPQTFGELLDFGTSAVTGPKLGLIITTQLQILRLMTSSRKNKHIEAALEILRSSHPSSPTKLLLLAAKDSKQTIKIARQLQSLSDLLLSLSPSISTSEDHVALESRLSVAPHIAIQLQTLALQNRLSWWKLSGHNGDVAKELFDPFFRCLSAFARRSQSTVLETYEISKEVFLSLQEALSDSQKDPKNAPKVFSGIYRLLGSLSQEAKLINEAISWTEEVQSLLDPKVDSDARRCAVVARLVALKLRAPSKDSRIEELLLTLLDDLERPFKGETSEIDDLLSEVSSVRRAAISLLAKRNPRGGDSADRTMDGISQMCESLVFLCPRLLLRYLGKSPDVNTSTKDILRHEQRRMFIAKPGLHAIDSTLFLTKVHLNESRLRWELMDSILQDCLSLLDRLDGGPKEVTVDEGASPVSYYVRVSNLYYTQYLNIRRDTQSSKDVQQQQRTLRRSIDCVRSRPHNERKSALLPTKLERMAEIYKTTSRYDELFKTLLSLRDEMINRRVLSAIALAAATQPIPEAWSINEDALVLARTMNSLLKVLLKYGFSASDMPIVEDSWSVEEKGAMLEEQLDILSGQNSTSHTAVSLRNKVFRALVAVYDGKQYPVRRLRVLTRFLSLELCHRQEVADGAKDQFNFAEIQEFDLNESKDEGLRKYLSHFNALAASLVELHLDQPNLKVLKQSLATWSLCLRGCKSLKALEDKIYDVAGLLAHLQSVADYMEMKGYGTTRIAVLRLIADINELCEDCPAPDGLILSYTDLGLQWLRLGYSGKAGLALDRAQSYSNRNGVMPQTLLELHLSYSEYLLAIGHSDKCEEHLMRAQVAASQNGGIFSNLNQQTTFQKRARRDQLVANAFLVYSMLALERGAPQMALSHAKQSVKLLRRAWASIEKHLRSKVSPATDPDKSDIEKLAEECSNLSVSQITISMSKEPTHQTLAGSGFWSLISPLFRSISLLSGIYAYNGMFQETLYYAEQAQKLVQEVGSEVYLAIASGAVGATWLRAGRLDKASEVLKETRELCLSHEKSQHTATLACNMGELHGLLGDRDAQLQAYDTAENTLDILTAADLINSMDRVTESVETLEAQMSQLTITTTKAKARRKATTTRAKVAIKRKAVSQAKSPAIPSQSIADACPQLASLKATVLRQKAKALMLGKDYEEALGLLQKASIYSTTQTDIAYQGICMAKQLLLQSLEQMNADPVYSVLQDSTISYPSVVSLFKAEKIIDKQSHARQSPPKKLNISVADRSRSKSPAPDSFFDKLCQAQDHLIAVHSTAITSAPISVVHIISALLNSVAILLSAAGPAKGKSLGHPGFATCSLETTRTIALRREHKAVQSDQQTPRIDDLSWPVLQACDSRRNSIGSSYDMSRFQRDYIDIIPKAWTAISISLSDSRQELSITKFQAGHGPFVLRLPLGRNNSIDADEEVFGFEQGHSELMDIINSANESAHSAGEMTGKEARTAWWEGREALDARLKDLLENIEKVWLGGFKGIFSQDARRPDLLARFQKSFQTTLDKHLPSRQKKTGKRSKSPRIALDTRILDLFIGLGDASAEDCDLDEPLTDLLYFVVDILQFHGELNAYAEIDFDSIVIEIHDALRCYHEAVQTSGKDDGRHTILILDKALHVFPWESLPCMEGLAVSRLPSMGCLRERLIEQQKAMPEDNPDGLYIDRDSGSFILNPEGDLKSTQATFQKDLLGLKGWDGVIKREPSESEIKRHLESKELFLYFGHGSGAQYIRAREIRRLDKCATTFLMGCSSGALIDAGEFEPYGPPINYMHAKCPALIATLWDVTDKDIDRFAKSTFEHWGLFGSEQQVGKGKGRKRAETVADRKLSVVEAVAKGREACNLRYLNAAAVCVYGVPVYLK